MNIGITGGIGSGKSYICKCLAKHGIKVYDCDDAAKRLIRESSNLQQQIKDLVGSLEKSAISKFLLSSESHQKALNDIIHPAVFHDFQISGFHWMESAILYESGANKLVDKVVVVTAPEEIRIQRIMQRDNISRENVMQWLSRQWPQEKVCSLSDYEIINDGTSDIECQIEHLLEQLQNISSQ